MERRELWARCSPRSWRRRRYLSRRSKARLISLEQPDGARVFQAVDVVRVRYANNRKRNVIRGMLIGMAVGGVVTAIIDRQSAHPSSTVETAGLGAVVIGLPVRAVDGALIPSGQLLYEAATIRKTPPEQIFVAAT